MPLGRQVGRVLAADGHRERIPLGREVSRVPLDEIGAGLREE